MKLFILFIAICLTTIVFGKKAASENLGYRFVTTDIDNFWEAYDALEISSDSIATIQQLYIDKASPEFEKFLEARNFTAEQYIDWIKFAPDFWKTIRPLTLAVKKKKYKIDSIYSSFQELYPEADLPNICFAITPIQSGGTTSKGLILIGTEIATVDPKVVDISQITGFMKSLFERSTGNIEYLVAHELIHTQQTFEFGNDISLLEVAVVEGSADFLAMLTLGELTMNRAIFDYGEAHLNDLWEEFQTDLNANRSYEETDWFYNYSSDRPADLGYYLGFKIAEAFYNKSEDKRKAIKEIIEMTDAKDFLTKSGL
jgi:hypothetical protein